MHEPSATAEDYFQQQIRRTRTALLEFTAARRTGVRGDDARKRLIDNLTKLEAAAEQYRFELTDPPHHPESRETAS